MLLYIVQLYTNIQSKYKDISGTKKYQIQDSIYLWDEKAYAGSFNYIYDATFVKLDHRYVKQFFLGGGNNLKLTEKLQE